tara:strand:+ start:103 stop:705 length:603 start_codon:yes stop_codon:yes gene_type:complete
MKWIGQHIWDFVSRFRADVHFHENVQLASSPANYAKTISFGSGRHMIVAEVSLLAAQRGGRVVIEIPGVKIPQYAMLVSASLTITELSSLGTYTVNMGISDTSGTAAGSTPSNYHELIGASATNSGSTADNDADADVDLSSGSGNLKKNWFNHESNQVGGLGDGELTADHYVYIVNAGNNGTSNPTSGKVYISIEYYGMD